MYVVESTQLFAVLILLALYVFYAVPTPTVSVTVLNNQTVGQSLTLQCEVTTVRGITSRVDIVWRSDGTELERINNITVSMVNISVVYSENYTISQLSTSDHGRIIECDVVINNSIINTGTNKLNVFGKFLKTHLCMHSSLFTLYFA